MSPAGALIAHDSYLTHAARWNTAPACTGQGVPPLSPKSPVTVGTGAATAPCALSQGSPWLRFPMWRAQSVWCDTLYLLGADPALVWLLLQGTDCHAWLSSRCTLSLSTALFISPIRNCTKGGSRINISSNTFSLACHCSSMIQMASNDRFEKQPGLVKCGNGKASECWQVLINPCIVVSATKWQ